MKAAVRRAASSICSGLRRQWVLGLQRAARLDATIKGMLWMALSGLLLVLLNVICRYLAQQLHPLQAQFLRYFGAVLVMLPLVGRSGWSACWPRQVGGQFARGAVHAAGLSIWFIALPRIPIADTTAIAFTGPIFIMLGARIFLAEEMRWERWVAAGIGLVGVLIVVGPGLSGAGGVYSLLMLASSPVLAASLLMTKALTRTERVDVLVLWQAITVTLFSLPLALWFWSAPNAWQWLGFVAAGGLGAAGQYCLARSFSVADISASQSVRFLDLVWAAMLGWMLFGEHPSHFTLIGGALICMGTLWAARRESRRLAR